MRTVLAINSRRLWKEQEKDTLLHYQLLSLTPIPIYTYLYSYYLTYHTFSE